MASESPRPTAILCFDFDGTLVDDGNPPFNPGFLEAMEAFKRVGAIWAINTGRTLFQTLEGLSSYGIDPIPDYLMVKERELYELGPYNRWVDVGDWNERCRREHQRFLKSHRRFFKEIEQFVKKETTARFIAHDDEPPGIVSETLTEMDRICARVDQMAEADSIVGYQRNSIYLRFSHADYDKGSVLQELARLSEVPPERIIAAGDNYNDLSMLNREVAHHLICPANALPEVQDKVEEQGGFIADRRASEGIIQGLAHFGSRLSFS